MTRNGFVSVDDPQYITQNPRVTAGLTWPGLVWALGAGYASNWHPLTWLSHMLDCDLYGLHPAGHHLTNLLLHTANTLVLFLLLRGLTGAFWRSALVAAFFACHPLHVESVAWASERKDVLSAFFFLLTLWAYRGYAAPRAQDAPPRVSLYLLSLLVYAMGLMSKPMLVTTPFVLLLLDYWPLERLQLPTPRRRPANALPLLLEKIPFFVLALAASIVTYLVQRSAGAVSASQDLHLISRLANALVSYLRYLEKTFWPANLAQIYPYEHHWPAVLVIGAALFLGVASGAVCWYARRRPYLVTGWFWFLGMLVPVIGIVQVGPQAMADRYMYLPSIGLFLFLAWLWRDLVDRRPLATPSVAPAVSAFNTNQKSKFKIRNSLMASVALVLLAACLVCTRKQVGYWQDGERLFRHALAVTANNYVAYDCLGSALNAKGRADEALDCFIKSVRLQPYYAEGNYNLGTVLLSKGDLTGATNHFAAALASCPNFAPAHMNLGSAYLRLGLLEDADRQFSQTIALLPDDPGPRYDLGTVLSQQGRWAEAEAQFSAALRLNPDYVEAQRDLGVVLATRGRLEQAAPHFERAVRLRPNDPDLRFNLGLCLLDQNQPVEAGAQFSEAVRLKPDDTKSHYRLAIAVARQHRSKEAIAQYREALRLTPQFPEALNELAWILASDPDPDLRSGEEAVRLAEQACQLTANQQPAILATLAAAYAQSGRFSEAVATAQKARELAQAAGLPELAAKAEATAKLYQSGRPLREGF